MKHTINTQGLKKLLTTLFLTGAVTVAPLVSSIHAAHADDYESPIWRDGNNRNRDNQDNGYYRGRNRNRDDNYNRDRTRNGNGNYDDYYYGDDEYRRRNTYSGVVTRVFSDSQFQVQLSDGRFLRVATQDGISGRLNVGDRVNVRGNYNADNSLFIADVVNLLGNRGRYGNGGIYNDPYLGTKPVSFPATITRVSSRNQMTVRGDNGRSYNVQSNSDLSYLRAGQRVRVIGTGSGNRVIATRISR